MASCTKDVCGVRPAYTEDQLASMKKRLSPEAFEITQKGGTERPFTGKYDKHYKDGKYQCIVCGSDLFNSDTKFNSGSGWPSFFQALPGSVKELVDRSHGSTRTEVQCKSCSAHLGHVFNDGPADKTGLRYCMNSASLDFKDK